METLKLSTIGSAPEKVMNFTAKEIADDVKSYIDGRPASPEMVNLFTQDIIERFNIRAKYTSGTFLSFRYDEDEVVDWVQSQL